MTHITTTNTKSKTNFKTYLAGRDPEKYWHLLMEGLTDIKQLVFPNVDMNSAIRFLRFMPGWKNGVADAKVELEFESEEQALEFKRRVIKFLENGTPIVQLKTIDRFENGFGKISAEKTAGAKTKFEIPAEGVPDDAKDRYFEQMFSAAKTFFGRSGRGKLIGSLSCSDGSVWITTDDEADRESAWTALAAVMNDGEVSWNTLKAVTAWNERKGQDQKAAKAAMKPFVQAVQTALGKIKPPAEADEKTKKEIEAGTEKAASSSGKTKTTFSGNYNECAFVYCVRRTSPNLVLEHAKMFELAEYFKLSNITEKGMLPEKTGLAGLDIWNDFAKAATVTGNIDKRQRRLLQMFNRMCEPRTAEWKGGVEKQIAAVENKMKTAEGEAKASLGKQLETLKAELSKPWVTPAAVLDKMKKERLGLKIFNYMKLHEADAADARSKVLEKYKDENVDGLKGAEKERVRKKINDEIEKAVAGVAHADIDRYETLEAAFAEVEKDTKSIFDLEYEETEIVSAEKKKRLVDNVPNLTSPVAKRRWKLFEKFRKTDNGEVYSNADWTMSVCRTDAQIGIFGRNKPKVDSKGRILEDVNLDDDEGITPENKKLRDGPGNWVKDGLGELYDKHETETTWCIAATFGNRDNSTQTPKAWNTDGYVDGAGKYGDYRMMDAERGYILLQFMENSTGRLFMCGDEYILDEADKYEGSLNGIKGLPTLRKNCARFRSFDQLMTDSGLKKSLMEYSGGRQLTRQELMAQALSEGVVSPTGEMIIGARQQLEKYKSLIENVSKIIVRMRDARQLFADTIGGEKTELPPVDCEDVRLAGAMFSRVFSPSIDLLNTDGITDMSSMFRYSQTERVTGLDTRSAKDISYIFDQCRQKVFQMVSIPALDLRNCASMTKAFSGSYLSEVVLTNTDKVESAVDAFVDMPFLQKVPDIRFKRIIDPERLRTDFKGDYTTIFDSCDSLLGRKDFDEQILKIRDFYENSKDRVGDFLDDRHFVIVGSRADVDKYSRYFYKYAGVVVSEDAESEWLFYNIDSLKIRVLDLNGREDASRMFRSCRNFAIGKIIGTENLKKADMMFEDCSCNICPKLDFPKLTGPIKVFVDMWPFGNCASKDLLKTGSYVEEFANLPDNAGARIGRISARLFGTRHDEWENRTVIINVVENIYEKNVKRRLELLKNAYEPDENGVVTVGRDDIINNIDVILDCKPKTIRFSDEFVDRLNHYSALDGTDGEGLWKKMKKHSASAALPDIDLNGLKNGNFLFLRLAARGIGKIKGLEKLETADEMFRDVKITAEPKSLRAKYENLESGNRMFMDSNIRTILARDSFPKLVLGDSMFQNAHVIFDEPAAELVFPRLESGSYMFEVALFENGNIETIDAPRLKTAANMFFETNLKSVGSVDIPAALVVEGMFDGCEELESVGTLSAPVANNFVNMFLGCLKLEIILRADVGTNGTFRSDGMFDKTPVADVYGSDGKAFIERNRAFKKLGIDAPPQA